MTVAALSTTTRSDSKKHSGIKASAEDASQDTPISVGFTYARGNSTALAHKEGAPRGFRPNRCMPFHYDDSIENIGPSEEALQALVDKYPAPAEWADE